MYIIRDIFQLKFGHYKEVKTLLKEAKNKSFLPHANSIRALTDFTGPAYRLIMEEEYDSMDAFEKALTGSMGQEEWQKWYEKFKQHVESSYREILKVEKW